VKEMSQMAFVVQGLEETQTEILMAMSRPVENDKLRKK
jgi:hypothetical protein